MNKYLLNFEFMIRVGSVLKSQVGLNLYIIVVDIELFDKSVGFKFPSIIFSK